MSHSITEACLELHKKQSMSRAEKLREINNKRIENLIKNETVKPLYTYTLAYERGMRSGKLYLVAQLEKGRRIVEAYRQELNNVMTQNNK